MSILSVIKKVVSTATSLINPLKAPTVISAALSKVTGIVPAPKTALQTKVESVTNKVATVVSVAQGAVLGIAAAKTPVGSTVVKAAAAKPLQTTLVAGTSIVAGSALLTSPKLLGKVSTIPSGLVNVGSNIGKLAETPSVSNATQIFKENPIITSALIAGVALTGGAAASGLISSAINTRAIRENTKATQASVQTIVTQIPTVSKPETTEILQTTNIPAPIATPIVTPTTSTTPTITKKKKKKKKAKKTYKKKKKTYKKKKYIKKKTYKKKKKKRK